MEKRITFESNKDKLVGILNINNNTNEVIVICHARTSSKNSRPTIRIAELMNEIKKNNFRFDFIACGESEGNMEDYTVSNMVTNLNDTLEFLKINYSYNSFILIGCSMGARIISLVDNEKYIIKKLILWYGALDFDRGFLNLPSKKEKIAKKQGYYKGENGWNFSYNYFKDERKYMAYKRLYKWDVPKLFVHGSSDQFVNCNNSIKVSKKCKNSKLYIVKNGDHGFHNENNMIEALNITKNFVI